MKCFSICSACGKIGDKSNDSTRCVERHQNHIWEILKDYSKFSKDQKNTFDSMKKFDNKTLLDATILAASGDSYDGCFTDFGEWEYQIFRDELYQRLSTWLES